MTSKRKMESVGLNVTNGKMKWELPEIIDLDINDATQNQVSGPSVNDGGAAFSDYNS